MKRSVVLKGVICLTPCLGIAVASGREGAQVQNSLADTRQKERRLEDGVVSLTVLDGDRGVRTLDDRWDFLELVDGVTIDLDDLGSLTEEDTRGVHWGSARINIRANTEGQVGSVVFDYDDGDYVSTVQTTNNPYTTLMWHRDFVFRNGHHTLRATGWSGKKGDGMELGYVEVGFTIVSATAEGAQNVPEFTMDEWVKLGGEDYPIDVTEAPSALLDGNLVLFSGYTGLFSAIPDVFAKDLRTPGSPWRRMPDFPLALGATHIPIALNGPKAYLVGGYLGRVEHPPPHMVEVFEFDVNGNNGKGSWREMPPLPTGRGAGAAFYLEGMDTIMYTLGATHARGEGTTDHLTTWWLDLKNEAAGWIRKGDGPYLGNHVKETVAKDCDGNLHYYVYGGQLQELQRDNNLDEVWEYFPETDHWEQRASLIQGRGHLASSPYSCGFFVIGGAINFYPLQGMRTHDMSYYDIPTDTWTRVGDAHQARDNYACDIFEDTFYCTGGGTQDFRMRTVTATSPPPVPSPQAPTPVPPSTSGEGKVVYKINCGGVFDPSFPDWEVDDAFTSDGRAIARNRFGASRPNYSGRFMYNTERRDVRQDPIEYEFPVDDGTYDVQIYWMEAQDVGVGDRTMDISVEGSMVLSEFDIFDYADGELGNGAGARNTPFIYTIPSVVVSDGSLSISFAAELGDAKVNGLAITKHE